MGGYIYYLLGVFLVLNSITFRFQGIVNDLCFSILQIQDRELCRELEPLLCNLLHKTNIILWLVLSVLIYFQFGWVWVLGLAVYFLLGTRIVDIFLPVPSRKSCVARIQKNLCKKLIRSGRENNMAEYTRLQKLMADVAEAEEGYEMVEKNVQESG